MSREAMEAQPARSPEVDAFLASLPPDVKAALERLREIIGSAAPAAVEAIAYGVPAFRYRGRPLVSFGAARNHCSFYVQSPPVMDANREELSGYSTSRGTVHFTPDKPLPRELVTSLVLARVAETDAAPRR